MLTILAFLVGIIIFATILWLGVKYIGVPKEEEYPNIWKITEETVTPTRFPGIKDEDIIESKPLMIREDQEKPREEKKWPINLDLKLKPFKKGKRLSDIPNAIIITSQKYGEHKVNMLKVAIYSFNDQCFYSDGEKYPQENIDVVAYGTYDFNKVQEI